MAMYLSDIVAYFENLCVNHPDLNHDEATGERIFEVKAYEEAFSDFRTAGQEKTFFVRFILPTMSFKPQGNNATKEYQAGLLIGRYYSRRDDARTAMVEAWSDAERIADDFMARMALDSRSGEPLFNHSVDNVAALDVQATFEPVDGDGSFASVLYTFNFGVFRCMDPDGSGFAAWKDL